MAGDTVTVEADVFADGTESVNVVLRYGRADVRTGGQSPMTLIDNDRWRASFSVPKPGIYRFSLRAWTDPVRSWRNALRQRVASGAATEDDLRDGISLLRAVPRSGKAAKGTGAGGIADELERLLRSDLRRAVRQALDTGWWPDAPLTGAEGPEVTECPELRVVVDPEPAQASAWYELFPRSASPDPMRPGTFADVLRRVPEIAELGFDTLYLPPIHPIGTTHRRGPNNAPSAGPGDPGSPWAIGSSLGGHTSIAPELGSPEEFRTLVDGARRQGVEVALDLAFQCSPDHPWVTEHPSWFRHRADGTIRTAENPPKKYDDIYPFDFDSPDADELWTALLGVVRYWIDQGVRRFRVDNPHTKPFEFWAWLLSTVRAEHPEVLFLAEAFTRPKVMYRLAQVGFTHSYTYFAWRNTKQELTEYFGELATAPLREYFRPHLWTNTPDILTDYLQTGGRPAFAARFVLAATLSPNYGIYGPSYEWCDGRALVAGKEEYQDSEKYQVRHWEPSRAAPLAALIRSVNRARTAHRVLTSGTLPVFQGIDNPSLIGYSKFDPAQGNAVLVFVNLDPLHPQSGMTNLDLARLGLGHDETFEVHDQLTDRRFAWRGTRNYVELRPNEMPAHLFVVRRARMGPNGVPQFA